MDERVHSHTSTISIS